MPTFTGRPDQWSVDPSFFNLSQGRFAHRCLYLAPLGVQLIKAIGNGDGFGWVQRGQKPCAEVRPTDPPTRVDPWAKYISEVVGRGRGIKLRDIRQSNKTGALALSHDVLDRSSDWVSPGLIDLHSHVAGRSFFTNDLNDMVYLTNPGIRAFTSVVPGNSDFVVGRAAGVTSVLYIPGSGTNIGGHGVLLKTGFDTYERMEIRNPGSLKLAQAGNPESYLSGVGRSFMNWNTRNTIERGSAYAKRWEAFSNGDGPRPKVDPMWEVFRDLYRLKSTKTLSFGERRMLDTAKSLIVNEISVARKWDEQRVEKELEKAFAA